jgi:hypothetical protein
MWRQRRGGNAPRSGGLKVDPRCLLAAVDRGDAASIAGWFKLAMDPDRRLAAALTHVPLNGPLAVRRRVATASPNAAVAVDVPRSAGSLIWNALGDPPRGPWLCSLSSTRSGQPLFLASRPWPGPKTAARCSASPRPRPQPLFLASRPASAPTASRTPDRRRARPSRPVPPRAHRQPAWPTLRAHLLPWRLKASSTPSCTCRQPPPDETSARPATWPPSSTGASQRSRLPTQVRCLGSRAFHQRFMPISSGGLSGAIPAGRRPRGQVQDHACQGDAEAIWAAAGTHHSALVGEIAVWRAANGINPQDPRPTGGTQLETLPALGKQRLDRDVARATDQPANARANKRQAGRTAPSSYHDLRRPYQTPGQRPSGRSAPRR